MLNKIYLKHIYSVFIFRFIFTTLIFSSLIFVLNILEELKFFSQKGDGAIGFTILLTFLNLPSILFEIFPFIILIATQFFFIKFQTNSEILIFKNNGITNFKIISSLSLLVFFIGLFIIFIFHFISSNMKHNYLEFKNQYTTDNKYLAFINENGLWIKDKMDGKTMIIHSERVDKNVLRNLVITIFDSNFNNEKSIVAKEAIINNEVWDITSATVIDNTGRKEYLENINLKTNFDYLKINSLFSNLESLNIFQLFKQKKDFEAVGISVAEIDMYINKVFSLPISLVIFLILTSVIMFNLKFNKSKSFTLISGILMSVVIYYIYYFFSLLGSNNKIPISLAVWMPNLLLLLTCMIGIVNINEK